MRGRDVVTPDVSVRFDGVQEVLLSVICVRFHPVYSVEKPAARTVYDCASEQRVLEEQACRIRLVFGTQKVRGQDDNVF